MCQEKAGLSLWDKDVIALNGIVYREEASQVSEMKSMMTLFWKENHIWEEDDNRRGRMDV